MPRWIRFSCVGVLAAISAGCMSAETSEASQLTRLEHGIDVSTTPPDRFTSRGELPGDGKLVEAPPASPSPGPPPAMANPAYATPSEPPVASLAADDPADDSPRPVIRVWGAPGGRTAPGFVPVTKIVFDGGAIDPAGRPVPSK